MKKTGKILVVGILVMLAVIGIACADVPVPTDPGAPTTTVGVTGTIIGPFYGTPENDLAWCESLGWISVTIDGSPTKIDPVESGTYYFDGGKVMEITVDGDSKLIDFTANFAVEDVVVKGGPYANVFHYSPGVYADTGLHAPVNPENDEYYGLSHVLICNPTEAPEFPTIAVPTGLLIGLAGVVLFLNKKE